MSTARSPRYKPDVRLRAIITTLVLVLLTGTVVYLLPGKSGEVVNHGGMDEQAGRFQPDASFDERFRDAAMSLHRKDYAQALGQWESLARQAPKLPEVWVNLGYTLLGLNRHQDAEQVFQHALSLRSSQANAYYGLALALEGQDRYADAAFNMQAFLERTPADDPYVPVARERIRTLMDWEAERQSCEPQTPTSLKLVDNKAEGGSTESGQP